MRNRRISENDFEKMLERRTILKNVVMRRISEIQDIMKKPKLTELLSMFREKSDPQERQILLEKMKKMYQSSTAQE